MNMDTIMTVYHYQLYLTNVQQQNISGTASLGLGPLPLCVNLVGLLLPELPLLLAGDELLAGGDVVLVGVGGEEMAPGVVYRLLAGLPPVQSLKGLQELTVAHLEERGNELARMRACYLVVLEVAPGVHIVGGCPEAWLCVAVALPVGAVTVPGWNKVI